jgi:hypothetical protein
VEFGKLFLDGIGSDLGLIMRNGGIEMMGDVGRSNLVMQEINRTPRIHFIVGTINGVQGSLDKVVVVFGKVRNVDICVLKPLYVSRQKVIQ